MVKIAIDAMGGDFGPYPIVEGTLLALKEYPKFKAVLVGKREKIEPHLSKKMFDQIEIVEASDVIGMDEPATEALKRKESSIYKAVDLVRNQEADAVVSAGHSGATMSLATLRIGRLRHVSRPAIATLMPTYKLKKTLVLDVGANVDCKPEHLFEFGVMGEAYAKAIMQIDSPKVGLLSNGEEETKGNELTKSAFGMLRKLPTFIGNVEGNNIFDGSVDVVVCDGFVGNVVLKTCEGLAKAFRGYLKALLQRNAWRTFGAMLCRGAFREFKELSDSAQYGGAPLLGVNGVCIIGHGASSPFALRNAIRVANECVTLGVNDEIVDRLAKLGLGNAKAGTPGDSASA